MKTVQTEMTGSKPTILTVRIEEILKTVYFYRYVSALDMAHLLYKPGSHTYVRSILTDMAGGDDGITSQYLYRFRMPNNSSGNAERIFTLGSKGRDFLAKELGMPVQWYFRPHKVKDMSYVHALHNVLLTRFLVAAHSWSKKQPHIRLAQTSICYEFLKTAPLIEFTTGGFREVERVIPDGWLLFETLQDGEHGKWLPILLEIDRGMEYQQKFKQHVRARIEFIRCGAYKEMFANEAVIIAYATTGRSPEYRETRLRAMCAWTKEVLNELDMMEWASAFRFHSFCLNHIYKPSLFQDPVWYIPGSKKPAPLLTL